jgi:hypothetical protein
VRSKDASQVLHIKPWISKNMNYEKVPIGRDVYDQKIYQLRYIRKHVNEYLMHYPLEIQRNFKELPL